MAKPQLHFNPRVPVRLAFIRGIPPPSPFPFPQLVAPATDAPAPAASAFHFSEPAAPPFPAGGRCRPSPRPGLGWSGCSGF